MIFNMFHNCVLGPLIQYDSDTDAATVIGVVSFGFQECGSTRYPAIYAKVDHFLPWIHEIMNDYS